DADGDGDEDLLVTNFSLEPNAFYVNEGGGVFNDQSDAAGLGGPSRPMLGWGTVFLDADLDGALDLVAANGHVYSQADREGTGTSFAQPDMLWFGNGGGHFREAPWAGDVPAVSRALAAGDLDDDGLPDLVITRLFGAPSVLRGTTDASRALQVRVVGRPGNPDGVGTTLRLVDGAGTQVRRVRVSAGYQACSDPRPVFAYRGPATLEVVFPDGSATTVEVTGPGRVAVEVPQE
ncbi:MAG: FG-GAP-like repeat-containing protein, partial [Planctomycetota bacterium]